MIVEFRKVGNATYGCWGLPRYYPGEQVMRQIGQKKKWKDSNRLRKLQLGHRNR